MITGITQGGEEHGGQSPAEHHLLVMSQAGGSSTEYSWNHICIKHLKRTKYDSDLEA